MTYNTSVQLSTGLPFYLMFDCQARLPVDTVHGIGRLEGEVQEEGGDVMM